MAAAGGHKNIVKVLAAAGADPEDENAVNLDSISDITQKYHNETSTTRVHDNHSISHTEVYRNMTNDEDDPPFHFMI